MIEWFTPGRAMPHKASYISINVTLSSNKDGKPRRPQLCVSFSEEAVSDLRLVLGDRMIVGYDATHKQLALRRVTDGGGFKLTRKSGPKASASTALVLSVTADFEPTKRIQIEKPAVSFSQGNTIISINGLQALQVAA